MRFIVMVRTGDRQGYENGKMPDPKLLETMGRFNQELIDAGVMVTADGIRPSRDGMRVHFPAGYANKPDSLQVSEGPFDDGGALVAGFWLWNVKSKEEALAWAKRAPMEDGATLEIRPLFEAADFG